MTLSILAMLISCIIFGNIIGGIKNVLLKFYSNDRYFKYMITDLRIFRKSKKLPSNLFVRMYHYIRFLKWKKKENLLEESLILQDLSLPIN